MSRPARLLPYSMLSLVWLAGCAYLFPSCQTIPGCPTGQILCNNLTCSDLHTDPFNCGSCWNACAAGLSCVDLPDSGAACGCVVSGQALYGGACIDTGTDPNNCGTVGYACRADQICANGLCGCPSANYLDAGNVECPTDAGPRCAQLTTDPQNCGACGVTCAVSCVAGSCSDAGVPGGPTDAGASDDLDAGGDDAGVSAPGDGGADAGDAG